MEKEITMLPEALKKWILAEVTLGYLPKQSMMSFLRRKVSNLLYDFFKGIPCLDFNDPIMSSIKKGINKEKKKTCVILLKGQEKYSLQKSVAEVYLTLYFISATHHLWFFFVCCSSHYIFWALNSNKFWPTVWIRNQWVLTYQTCFKDNNLATVHLKSKAGEKKENKPRQTQLKGQTTAWNRLWKDLSKSKVVLVWTVGGSWEQRMTICLLPKV